MTQPKWFIYPDHTFVNPDMRYSVYWSDQALARQGIIWEDLQEGRVDYFALVASEGARLKNDEIVETQRVGKS